MHASTALAGLGLPGNNAVSRQTGRPSRPRRLAPRNATLPDKDPDAESADKGAWRGALLGALAAPLLAAPSTQALEVTAVPPAPLASAAAQASPPTSVRQLLKELRSQSDRLEQTQWELEATQKLLYKSQEQVLIKQQEMQELREEMKRSQPGLLDALGALAAGGAVAAGALGGLRAYLRAGLGKIELEKRRADAGLDATVKARVKNEAESEVQKRVAAERAKEAAIVVSIVEAERFARTEAEVRAKALQERAAELEESLDKVNASLAAVREAKQAAETQIALSQIEVEAKARAAEEVRKAQEEASTKQQRDFMSVMQQLMAERSRTEQLQQQLEQVTSAAQQGEQASAASQAALEELEAEQKRSAELAERVAELVAQQEAAAARFKEAQEQLELERSRTASLQERLEAAKAVADEQMVLEESATSERLRETNQKYLATLDELHEERSRVADLQSQLGSRQAELARIADDVARLRQRANTEVDRLRSGLTGNVEVDLLKVGLRSLERQAEAAAATALEQDSDHLQQLQQLRRPGANGHLQWDQGSATHQQQQQQAQHAAKGWATGGASSFPLFSDSARYLGEELRFGTDLHNGLGPSEQVQQNGHGQAGQQQQQQGLGGSWAAGQQQQQEPAEHPAWVQETAAAIPEAGEREVKWDWTDPLFTAQTLNAFPDKAVADVEEARCLLERGGYTMLDVRPQLELDVVGRVRGCANIPWENAQLVYNNESRSKEVERNENADFLAQVEKRFPNKNSPLLVGCSDGRSHSIEALTALDEAGYTRLVGLKGGFHAWFSVFDAKGRRRHSGGSQLARST